jgi:hypothetical protein
MILPQPDSHLPLNILVLGSDILRLLKKHKTWIVIEEIMEEFVSAEPRRTHEIFMNVLAYLYALGLVEYEGYKIRLNDYSQGTLL